MKAKSLIVILMITVVVLLYNLFCYNFVSKVFDNETRYAISSYFNKKCNNCDYSYKYKIAILNEDNTLNVYVKYKSELEDNYYRFNVIKINGVYHILEVDNEIPAFIR